MSIKTSYTLQFEHTGQKWSVPDDCIKMIDGKAWLRVSGTKYGFVKLAMGDAMPSKNPSLASFPPWKNLLQQRNEKSQRAPSTSDLFGDEAEGGQVNKKRKRKPPATQDGDSGCIELAWVAHMVFSLQGRLARAMKTWWFSLKQGKLASFASTCMNLPRMWAFSQAEATSAVASLKVWPKREEELMVWKWLTKLKIKI